MSKDHLGNLRAVINRNKNGNGQADIVYYSDYYPFGFPLTLANNDYRYGYQGQYAEVDKETGWNNFDFRMYDAQIARWMSTDPMGQYASPYLGMGNNPLNHVDPDGGEDGPKPRPVVNWKDFNTSEMVVRLNDVNIHKFTPRETVSAKEFNFWDRFASSNDISVKFTYDLIDAPYVWFTQAFSMDKGARHLDQTSATYNDRMSAGISTMLIATGPVSRAYSEIGVLKSLGRGSTGRTAARDLGEELAMQEAKSNPALGRVAMGKIGDPRWKGWQKMEYIHRSLDGSNISIHYVGKWKNGVLRAVDDFKFQLK